MCVTGKTPPESSVVPWCWTWRLQAPEFDVVEEDNDHPPSASESVLDASLPIVYSSFGEFAKHCLGFSSTPPIRHIAWNEKTPFFTVAPSSAMAYRFVDPTPFLPPHAQRVMVQGRPPVMRVVTGRVHERNNDVAIAHIHPLPKEQVNFEVIRETLSNFLNVQLGVPTISVQPCPHGQAYVRFSHLFQ